MRTHPSIWADPRLGLAMEEMTVDVTEADGTSFKTPDVLPGQAPRLRFYSFYFLDGTGRILFGEDQECKSDAHALSCGLDKLSRTTQAAVEVWFRGSRLSRMRASESKPPLIVEDLNASNDE